MRQRLKNVTGFWCLLLKRFFADRTTQSAAALTFATLFAVVPMMTVTFSMLSAIPTFQGVSEEIQNFVFRNFVPSSGLTVQKYLQEFTVQARELTWVGVVLLAVTAFMMLRTIERTFNGIWCVRQPRRGVPSFLLYWAVLSLGPLLLGVGFAISTYVTSLSLLSGPESLIGLKTLLGFTPVLFSVAAFTLIYASVPNAWVPLHHALLGGLFAAVLFEVAKALFGLFVSLSSSYQLIYGAFAAIPLFLLWIYLSWLIVLFGAELVCNLSSSRHWRRRELPRVLALLGILRVFHENQLYGVPVRHKDLHREGWLLPDGGWEEVFDFLESQQLICQVSGGNGWVLCRDLERFSLHELFNHSPWPLPNLEQLPDTLDNEPWYPGVRWALDMLNQEQSALFSGSLAHWLRTTE